MLTLKHLDNPNEDFTYCCYRWGCNIWLRWLRMWNISQIKSWFIVNNNCEKESKIKKLFFNAYERNIEQDENKFSIYLKFTCFLWSSHSTMWHWWSLNHITLTISRIFMWFIWIWIGFAAIVNWWWRWIWWNWMIWLNWWNWRDMWL